MNEANDAPLTATVRSTSAVGLEYSMSAPNKCTDRVKKFTKYQQRGLAAQFSRHAREVLAGDGCDDTARGSASSHIHLLDPRVLHNSLAGNGSESRKDGKNPVGDCGRDVKGRRTE